MIRLCVDLVAQLNAPDTFPQMDAAGLPPLLPTPRNKHVMNIDARECNVAVVWCVIVCTPPLLPRLETNTL